MLMPGLRRSLIALVLLFTACSDDGPLSIKEIREIQAARARWLASPVRAGYRFEVRQSCFCPEEYVRWNTVTVINDTIIDVRATQSGEVVPAARRSSYLTVEEMFASLPTGRDEYLVDVQVRFDPQYGYPLEISTFARPEIADGGGSIFARNLQPAR
jgi:hypothetical protein